MYKIVVLENSCNFKQFLSALFVSFGLLFVYVFNFRSFYIPLLMVALDEILVSIPVYLDCVSYFVLLEAPVGVTSCLGSKLRRLGDRRFTALAVGYCFKVINL